MDKSQSPHENGKRNFSYLANPCFGADELSSTGSSQGAFGGPGEPSLHQGVLCAISCPMTPYPLALRKLYFLEYCHLANFCQSQHNSMWQLPTLQQPITLQGKLLPPCLFFHQTRTRVTVWSHLPVSLYKQKAVCVGEEGLPRHSLLLCPGSAWAV